MYAVPWILGIAFLIACPQALPVALGAVAWLLADPVGTALLGAMFVASLIYAVTSGGRGYGVRKSW